jgi:hypothetical protein
VYSVRLKVLKPTEVRIKIKVNHIHVAPVVFDFQGLDGCVASVCTVGAGGSPFFSAQSKKNM